MLTQWHPQGLTQWPKGKKEIRKNMEKMKRIGKLPRKYDKEYKKRIENGERLGKAEYSLLVTPENLTRF